MYVVRETVYLKVCQDLRVCVIDVEGDGILCFVSREMMAKDHR